MADEKAPTTAKSPDVPVLDLGANLDVLKPFVEKQGLDDQTSYNKIAAIPGLGALYKMFVNSPLENCQSGEMSGPYCQGAKSAPAPTPDFIKFVPKRER